jgi:hypothetical protein
MKYNQITYEACQPAFSKASQNARANGMPYGITITTTPNNTDVPAGAYCYQIMTKAAKWSLDCFDMDDEKLDDYIRKNSENDFIFVQYTYKELGRDDAWLQDQIRQCQGNFRKIKREILLEWTASMDESLFNEDQLMKIKEYIKEPKSRIFINNYPITFYETPDLNMNYILSCDVGGGLSHDNSVINIIHPEDFHVVGDFRNSKIDTDNFRKLIYDLMTVYFKNSVLVIERNSYGLDILQILMKDQIIEPRMYREPRVSLGEKTQTDGFTVKRKTQTIIYGVDTNINSRNSMMDILQALVDTEYDKFVSPNIYSDLCTLQRKKNGKIEHSSTGHDDSLMAYLIFRYAVYYGKCFRDRFGIAPIPTRTNVRTVSSVGDMSRITKILEEATKADNLSVMTDNPIYKNLLDQKRKIDSQNPDTQSQSILIDQILKLNE